MSVHHLRRAVAQHQLRADPPVGEIEHRVGQVRELFSHIRQRPESQHITQHNAQKLLAAEARQINGRGHGVGTSAVVQEKRRQPVLIFLG